MLIEALLEKQKFKQKFSLNSMFQMHTRIYLFSNG